MSDLSTWQESAGKHVNPDTALGARVARWVGGVDGHMVRGVVVHTGTTNYGVSYDDGSSDSQPYAHRAHRVLPSSGIETDGRTATVRRAIIDGQPWSEYVVNVVSIDGDTLTYTTDGVWVTTAVRNDYCDWSINGGRVGTQLPETGYLRIYATAECITTESAEHGDADRRGWVEDLYRTDVWDNRNYVAPVLEYRLSDGLSDDDVSEIASLVSRMGAYESGDGSTLYMVDAVTLDYATDEVWSYALHAHVKTYDPARGYVEDDCDIVSLVKGAGNG